MRFLRMLIGYLLACFGAAFVWSLFALSPPSIEAFFDKLPELLESAWGYTMPWMWGAVSLLAAIPALIAFQYAESNGIRSWVYYELVGAAMGIAAYWLAHGTETVPVRADGNIYGTITLGVAGAVLGLLYWLFSGRYAGLDRPSPANRPGGNNGKPQQTLVGKPAGPVQGKKPATA
jgi:MFS family permease